MVILCVVGVSCKYLVLLVHFGSRRALLLRRGSMYRLGQLTGEAVNVVRGILGSHMGLFVSYV